jgi:hypothetical protein
MVGRPDLMSWYYDSNSGAVQNSASWDPITWAQVHSGFGWHGPFPSKQAALNYYSANKAANPGWKAPAGIASNIKNSVTNNPVTNTVTAPFLSVGQFLSKLGNPNLWIRVGEFTIGAALLIVGLAHLTGADSTAMKIATKTKLL